MGDVVYGVDFRKRRADEFDETQKMVIRALCIIIENAGGYLTVTDDTAPCEYCAPESDPA